MLSSKMPVNIDRAKASLVVGDGERSGSGVSLAVVTLGHIGSRLFRSLLNGINHTLDIGQVGLLSSTGILSQCHSKRWVRISSSERIAIHVNKNFLDNGLLVDGGGLITSHGQSDSGNEKCHSGGKQTSRKRLGLLELGFDLGGISGDSLGNVLNSFGAHLD